MDPNLRNATPNSAEIARYLLGEVDIRIAGALRKIQLVYYPVLAIVAVPVNMVTIIILSRGKCGLSKAVTRYLVAMVAADQLVVVFDLLLRRIPNIFIPLEVVIWSLPVPVCKFHAVVLNSATDCSVWFTVSFTFDRFVAICFQKLKGNYCTGRVAALVLGTVTLLSCVKNLSWYFLLAGSYTMMIGPLLCMHSRLFSLSQETTFLMIHVLLTPILPFVLILLLNCLTIRYVLVASLARRRLHGSRDGETPADPAMRNRRQSLLLLLVMSGNFILLWALFTAYSVWESLYYYNTVIPSFSLQEVGYMLQMLSCCTNTALYAVIQARFRVRLKETVKSPFRSLATFTRRCLDRINPQLRFPIPPQNIPFRQLHEQ